MLFYGTSDFFYIISSLNRVLGTILIYISLIYLTTQHFKFSHQNAKWNLLFSREIIAWPIKNVQSKKNNDVACNNDSLMHHLPSEHKNYYFFSLLLEIFTFAKSSQSEQQKKQYEEDARILKAVQDSMAEWQARKSHNRYTREKSIYRW